jgi:hypothetical protein
MSQLGERHTLSFIVRLWAEPSEAAETPVIRVQVEHVGSGEKVSWQAPAALIEFLGLYLARTAQSASERDS